MDCPECGGSLDAYVLGGREAVTCVRCGWVGIEADHRGDPGVDESWGEALGRFYERHVETTRRADLPPVATSAGEETPDDGRDEATADEMTSSSGEGAAGGTSDDAGGADRGDGPSDADDSDADGSDNADGRDDADGSGRIGGDDESENGAAPVDDEAIRPG